MCTNPVLVRTMRGGVLSILIAAALSLHCAGPEDEPSSVAAGTDGEQVMRQYCGSCHLPTPATALDRETWLNGVLPVMAPKVGIGTLWGEYYPKGNDSTGRSISAAEWNAIVAYFEREAPDTLTVPPPPATLQSDLPLFTVQSPPWTSPDPPATVFVALDSASRQIYFTDAVTETMYRMNESMTSPTVVRSGHVGVDLQIVEGASGERHAIGTSIGTMRAIDNANGAVWALNLQTGSSRVLATGLPRPVCSRPGDFNQDGLRDWIVCGFGHSRGGLFLLEQQPDRTFAKHVIQGRPGAVDAQVGDFNGDGYPDVMVLFAHGNEGVWLFTNDRRGGFASRNLLRFPPVYGSTDFQLADFNDDGALDLLYVSGDNADFSMIPKPYHGLYLFLNRGDFQFDPSYFYPFNGATEAIAADFDADGDLDIGAIAFFADFAGPDEKDFVYLEQTEPLQFAPYAPSLPGGGRKMNMDVGDTDGDGDLDMILGQYSARGYLYEGQATADSASRVPFIILENQTQ